MAFITLLKQAGNDPIMRKTQDDFFDEMYYNPAMQWCEKSGFLLPLSQLVVYDIFIHSGGILDFLREQFTATPKDGSAVRVIFVDVIKVGVMVNYSEVEKINIVIGKTKLAISVGGVNVKTEKMKMEIGNEDIIFNGGENKRFVKIKELSDNLDSLKKYCQGLKTDISTG